MYSIRKRMHANREAHTSRISSHFGVGKIVAHLQRFFHWPQIKEAISKHVKGCVLCATSKPANRKSSFVEASKIVASTWGKTTRSEPWLANPFPFQVVTPTGDNGTNFPICLMLLNGVMCDVFKVTFKLMVI